MKMPLFFTGAIFSSIISWATFASAQPRDWGAGPWGYGMHYMWGSFGIGMMIFMLIFWVLIIAGAVALIRWLWNGPSGSVSASSGGETAEDILKNRYAKGEIDKQEFESKLQDIRNS
ncbi:SHOCT domain-containing protein [Nitrospinota bacterium]